MITTLIQDKLSDIRALLGRNMVDKAYLFGSACTGSFNAASDIDLVIRFKDGIDPVTQGDLWWAIYFALEDMLQRPVDLLTEKSISNPYFKKVIEQTRVDLL